MLNFLRSTPAKVATLLLLVQTVALYSSDRHEVVPDTPPLAQMPQTAGNWKSVVEIPVDEDTRSVLKADDLLFRQYVDNAGQRAASLFVAAFRSQRTGKAPHSPKNCLPGSGFTQVSSGDYDITLNNGRTITVNRYIVARGRDEQELVMYWYQSRDRVVGNEFKAKFWVMADALRYNRTDTALVRVVVRVDNGNQAAATTTARDFVKDLFDPLRHYLPA